MGAREVAAVVEGLNLKQVAGRLGVHYMTAYRYVRTGRLAATKVGSGWVVDPADLGAFIAVGGTDGEGSAVGVDWRGRLRRQLVVGDEPAAWRVLEQALTSGRTATECYVDLLAGALTDVAEASVADDEPLDSVGPHLAAATARRLVARLGARFRRPGRSLGTVVFGAPMGEGHDLPIAIVADLVRIEGFTCLELGADVPAHVFASAAERATDLVAVGIGVTRVDNLEAVRSCIDEVRERVPEAAVVVGGQGVRNEEVARLLGATAWAPDGARAVETIVELSGR